MATNAQMWEVAQALIANPPIKWMWYGPLNHLDEVKDLASSMEIELGNHEAIFIVGQCKRWLDDGKSWDLEESIIYWDMSELYLGKYELYNENSCKSFTFENMFYGDFPLDDRKLEELMDRDRASRGNVYGENTAQYMNLASHNTFALRQEEPDSTEIYVKQIR
jgi:hypothetical protein